MTEACTGQNGIQRTQWPGRGGRLGTARFGLALAGT
jgi:hypothetical protein